jgi:hypothetical protein
VIYWEPEQESLTEESYVDADEEEGEGCLPMLLLPLFMAAATAFAFLLAGFFINLIVHFESSQIKIIWIAGSGLLGFTAYSILTAIKNRKKKTRHK